MQPKYIVGIVLSALSAVFLLHQLKKEATTIHPSIIVGTNAEYQPYSFVQDGKITGFDIDLIQELAHRLGKEMVLKDMAFTTLLPDLQMGTLQVIAAGMSPTPERAEHVLFLEPHHSGDPLVLITPKGSSITSLEMLKNKTILVNEGFTADTFVSKLPDIDVLRLPTVADAFITLKNGRADAFVSAESSLQPFFALYGKDEWSVHTIPATEDTVALAVSKKHPELHQALQAELTKLKADGTVAALKKKWGLS